MALVLTQDQQFRMEVLNLLKGQHLLMYPGSYPDINESIKVVDSFVNYVKNGLDKPKTLV